MDGPITTNNINIEKLYNNINVTNLISDMWISQDLNNYYENYGQLLNVANKIKESLNRKYCFERKRKSFDSVIQQYNDYYFITFYNLNCD